MMALSANEISRDRNFLFVLLSIVFFLCISTHATAQNNNPIVSSTTGYGFKHGQLVKSNGKTITSVADESKATHTHPGIDIQAPINADIRAYAKGQVIKVIDEKSDCDANRSPTPEWCYLGYMVLIAHSEIGKKTYYTLYLHMNSPPLVDEDDGVEAGEKIGLVGETGAASGPHVHFEIRFFPATLFPSWGNIYGKGDKKESYSFRTNWLDPEKAWRNYEDASGSTNEDSEDSEETRDSSDQLPSNLDIDMSAIASILPPLGMLLMAFSGVLLLIPFIGGKRAAGNMFFYGVVLVVIGTLLPEYGDPLLSSALSWISELPWWVTIIIGALITISVLQTFVALFIGWPAANAFAGQLTAQLFLMFFTVLIAPIRWARRYITGPTE